MRLLVLFTALFFSSLGFAQVTATVEEIEGGSFVLAGPKGGKKSQVMEKGAVQHGDFVQVPKGTSARLVFPSGIQVALGSGARFKVDTDTSQKKKVPWLNRFVGAARVFFDEDVKKTDHRKFLIQTKSVVAGVRGTDFVVDDDGRRTEIHTVEGSVDIAKDRKDLFAGRARALGEGKFIRQPRSARALARIGNFNKKEFLNRLGKRFPKMKQMREKARQRQKEARAKKSEAKKEQKNVQRVREGARKRFDQVRGRKREAGKRQIRRGNQMRQNEQKRNQNLKTPPPPPPKPPGN